METPVNKLSYAQKTFGANNDWRMKKTKVILTDAQGEMKLRHFDEQPNKLALVISCFPEIQTTNTQYAYRSVCHVMKTHGECPEDENFWAWYVNARKTRVATMQRDFRFMYRYLQMNGYYSKSYMPMFLNFRLRQRDGVKKGDTVLTEDEVSFILRKKYDISTPENRLKQKALDIFILSLFTGARVADVRTIIKSQDENGNPVLLYHNHKGTRSQSVAWYEAVEGPLQRGLYKTQSNNKQLYAALRVALYESFPSSSNRVVNYYYLRPGQGRELKADSRIAHISFHSARHTFCTRLLRAGVSPSIVAQLAGHRSIQTTMRYYNWTRENEANDVLRQVYGYKSVAVEKPAWGEGANVAPLPPEVHAAMLPKAQQGPILTDDCGLVEKLSESITSKLSARQRKWQEKMKRLGIN